MLLPGDMIGKEDEISHNLWEVSEDQSKTWNVQKKKKKGSNQKCLINSGFCFLSVPVVFNNIQHPPSGAERNG